MKIEHLGFDYESGNYDTATTSRATIDFAPGLNVVDSNRSSDSHQLADLIGHVLYGARLERDSHVVNDRAGYVDIASSLGRFRLERHRDRANRGRFTEPRLTVAPLDGQAARPDTARELLQGVTPEIASRLLVLHSTDNNQLNWILSEELAAELCRLEQTRSAPVSKSTHNHGADELFARRDRLSHQIELLLSEKRRSSEALESAISELALETDAAERRLHEQRRELDGVLSQLSELETQLRYRELADFVGRASDEAYHSDQQPTLAGLDEEIAKWRRALAELEARDAHVRRELALLHPDDSSPLLPIADQRACISIAQRLVADLDSEVARYARPGDSTACLCKHTHARLHPLVDTLGQQVDKLGRLIAQYEAAIEGEQLKAEALHLGRSQTELRSIVEHLLDRRQARLRTSRARTSETDTESLPADWKQLHAELERRQSELGAAVTESERRLVDLTTRRDQLHRDRADLMNDTALASLRQELDEVTRLLDRSRTEVSRSVPSATPWRASDILAKLTDGRLREVRLTDNGRHASVIDRQGNSISQAALNDVDQRLLTLSLQLAAVAGAAQWGLDLPLLVADPFAKLPMAESFILALVLHDFARSGHQVLVVTPSKEIVDRLRSLGQTILTFGAIEPAQRVTTALPKEPSTTSTKTIVLHEADRFALQLDDSIERFSVFGDETAAIFSAISIRTVSDLLDADADDVSHALDRTGISSSIVELWQTHIAMLCYVPNLELDEVQLLTGAEIRNLEQLAEADADELYQLILAYLESPRGVRHRSQRLELSRNRVAGWISDTRRERSRWKKSRYASRWQRRDRGKRPSRRSTSNRRNGISKSTRRKSTDKKTRPLRFRLSRTSPVVDAPSVGPKTAKRLAKVGITTIADLLSADAEATAAALDTRHVTAETIVAWQHQSQLMCRVPELLARDTQVLVGCGFTTPEDIAAADAADLYEFAKSFTSTSEGSRVLRGSDPPDLARATKWVFWAGHRRAMEAA